MLAEHSYFFVGGQYVESGGKRVMAGQIYVELDHGVGALAVLYDLVEIIALRVPQFCNCSARLRVALHSV